MCNYDEDGDAAVYTRKYMNKLKNTVEILNRFKNLYYCLKFKIKFIQWFLRSQEKKIMSKNHPTKIVELLDNVSYWDQCMEKAYAFSKNKMTLPLMTENIISIYKNILNT
jgi:hypothetical protein